MPPKTGLMGTLSTLALGAGLALTGAVDANAQAQFSALCSWINTLPGRTPVQARSSIASLQDIMSRLQKTGSECVFGPTGEQFCKPCIELAAAKIVTLTAVAAGPAAGPRLAGGPPAGGGGPVPF
jgi:hypothetical protein